MSACSSIVFIYVVVFKHKTAYEMRISDWSSDVCSSDLAAAGSAGRALTAARRRPPGRRAAAARLYGSCRAGSRLPHQSCRPTAPTVTAGLDPLLSGLD